MNSKAIVVTPVFSTEHNERLPLLLQSIYWTMQQTHRDRVHVIVDDGSTDNTPVLLEEIAHQNPSVVVYHKSNGGSSSAINFGLERALSSFNPRYITISYSDDLLPQASLHDRIKLAEQTRAKMVYSDMAEFYEDGRPPRVVRAREFADSQTFYGSLVGGKHIPYPTMLWESDFFAKRVGGYDERITSGEDWDIAIRTAQGLMNSGSRHETLHQVTVAYRVHDNNLIYQNIKDGTKWKCYKMVLAKHLQGREYQLNLARQALAIAKALLPESVKKPLRSLRDRLLSSAPPILPYRDEFLEEVRKVDYQEALFRGK